MAKNSVKQNKKGSALIAVMCVLFLFMALILSMTLAAYQVLAHVYQYAAKEQCRVTAIDYSKLLEEQLNSKDVDAGYKLSSQIGNLILLNKEDKSWEYYNKDEPGNDDKEALTKAMGGVFMESNTDVTSAITRGMGDVTIDVYWKFSQAGMDALADDNPDFSGSAIVVSVHSELRQQKYTLVSEYSPQLIDPSKKWSDPKNWFFTKK